MPSRPFKLPRVPPLDREEWESYRQIDGRITVEKEKQFRARVFAGVSCCYWLPSCCVGGVSHLVVWGGQPSCCVWVSAN